MELIGYTVSVVMGPNIINTWIERICISILLNFEMDKIKENFSLSLLNFVSTS